MILGFLVLGSISWIGVLPTKAHRVAATIAAISFPVAGVIGQAFLVISMGLFEFTLEPRTNMLHHSLVWITTGVAAGLLGGLVGGIALGKMLPTQAGLSGEAAQRQRTAEAAARRI